MTFCDEVNADRLSLLRSDLKDAAERTGVRLSYLPLILKVGGWVGRWVGGWVLSVLRLLVVRNPTAAVRVPNMSSPRCDQCAVRLVRASDVSVIRLMSALPVGPCSDY